MSTADGKVDYPIENGFRMRGADMTRLETFTDAAFAFAITLLVIAVGELPHTYRGLIDALKGAPAFAVSFALMMMFWHGHRVWSRRYGLEDMRASLASLALVFVILLYIYPLRLMSAALAAFASGGRLPSEFQIESTQELTGLFVIYGIGFSAMASLLVLLYGHALTLRDRLELNEYEILSTRHHMAKWIVLGATGLVSTIWAGLLPSEWGIWAGMVYPTLGMTMPLVAIRYRRQLDGLRPDLPQSTRLG